MKFRIIPLIFISTIGLLLVFWLAEKHKRSTGRLPYERIGNISQSRIKEASGLTYHPQRKSLFVAGDEGHLYEMQVDGKTIGKNRLKQDNLEGLTVNPLTGLLYAAQEGKDDVLEIHPETLRVTRRFDVKRKFSGKDLLKKGGKGLEAIVFVPDTSHPEGGTFWVGNQSDSLKGGEPSALCEVVLPIRSSNKEADGRIVRFVPIDEIDISGLTYDPRDDRFIVINDGPNLLLEVKRNGEILHRYALPGKDQEGVTQDEDGFLYVAQENGEIIQFKKR